MGNDSWACTSQLLSCEAHLSEIVDSRDASFQVEGFSSSAMHGSILHIVKFIDNVLLHPARFGKHATSSTLAI